MSTQHRTERQSRVATALRRLAIPVILAWVGLAVLVSVTVPPLEQVAKEKVISLAATESQSVRAMAKIGHLFGDSNTDSLAIVILESDQPLGEAAHDYYTELVGKLKADTKNVQHVQDFWSDPLTAPAAQSPDGKAAYVQLSLEGNQGEARANQSVESVRDIVTHTPPPPGVKTYITGPTPLSADMVEIGDHSSIKITLVTVAVIAVMLLLVYRSVTTALAVLAMIGVELTVVRGVIAVLADKGLINVSPFAISILICLAIAAGTDYAIFFLGRYHEARQAGEESETAYYSAYRGVAHVILASGLTIAGATLCLNFAGLPIFRTLGAPCAIGMVIAVAVALTLIPAMLAVGGRFGLFDPKRTMSTRGWRRIGTAIVRWPAPIFIASCAVALIGLLALPGYRVNYDDRAYMPGDTPANLGWQAAERHFSESRMRPEILAIEADHDMRNSADFLVLNKLAKAIFAVEGVALVQGPTRPEGTPLEHTSLPFMLSLQNAAQLQNIQFVKNRLGDMRKQADELGDAIATVERTHELMTKLNDTSHHLVGNSQDAIEITRQIRDNVATFDDFSRPIRNYFYWEPHCENIPICQASRAAYDAMDGIDQISEKLDQLSPDLQNIDTILPQLTALLPSQISAMKSVQTMMLTMYSTTSGMIDQVEAIGGDVTAIGQDFDAARSDDSFYLPRDAFENPAFQRVVSLFLSPDGHAARFIITHRENPASETGISRINPIRTAAEEALKGTPLSSAKIYISGTAALLKDLKQGSAYDLLIAATASLAIIFIIMLLITRSFVASLLIVATVVGSLGASFGMSVLFWQHIMGLGLHWMVMMMSVIILLAVGADYNLLLVARFKEEMAAGLNTGIIRAMGGTGKVVTAAGLVFAFTMAGMIVSDLVVVGQVGTTIGLGLLFDTLVVRAFMMPSVAALLGRWFWWPLKVPMRSARTAGLTVSRTPAAPPAREFSAFIPTEVPVMPTGSGVRGSIARQRQLRSLALLDHPTEVLTGLRFSDDRPGNGSGSGSGSGASGTPETS